jgi:hypothetical protein
MTRAKGSGRGGAEAVGGNRMRLAGRLRPAASGGRIVLIRDGELVPPARTGRREPVRA